MWDEFDVRQRFLIKEALAIAAQAISDMADDDPLKPTNDMLQMKQLLDDLCGGSIQDVAIYTNKVLGKGQFKRG